MLDELVVIGLVMAIAELIKRGLKRAMAEDLVTQIVPIIVVVLGGGMNVLNAYIFAPEVAWRTALGQGIMLAATAAGIYSGTKALVGKS